MSAPRHTQRTRERVIAEFRRTGRVDLACAAVGIPRDTHYWWMRHEEKYKAAFEEAREQVAGLLEDEATRRAYHGTQRPVSIGGKQVMITEFSDNLLMFLLEHRNPAVFRRQVAEQVGSATTINLVVMDAGAEPKPIAPTNGHPPLQITVSET